jgi:hypothetical protein
MFLLEFIGHNVSHTNGKVAVCQRCLASGRNYLVLSARRQPFRVPKYRTYDSTMFLRCLISPENNQYLCFVCRYGILRPRLIFRPPIVIPWSVGNLFVSSKSERLLPKNRIRNPCRVVTRYESDTILCLACGVSCRVFNGKCVPTGTRVDLSSSTN